MPERPSFLLIAFLLVVIPVATLAQLRVNFYPYHKGDIRQYRSVYTGQLIYIDYTDSVKIDSLSKDIFVFGRNVTGSTNPHEWRIDSLDNLYNMKFQSQYVRYKLLADSGDSWQAGVVSDTVPVIVTVTNVYQGYVFGVLTTVKVFQFVVQNPPPQAPFWLGNDYLASGFGLIGTDVEPSDSYYLSGAVIDTTHYGVMVSVKGDNSLPPSFDILRNYPNPFNNATVITYTISTDDHVNITIYDLLGRLVRTLVDERKQKGSYNIYFSVDNLTSNAYFVVLRSNSRTLIHKMLLIK